MRTFLQDLRYGLRMLFKNLGFTVVAALALALGIGANTAIFSVVNAVLLRPLPFDEPDRVVMLWGSSEQGKALGYDSLAVSGPNYIDWRDQNHVFERMAAFRAWFWNLTSGQEPEQIQGARVSPAFFSTLGVKPILGRAFLPEEDRAGADKVVIIGYGLWQRRFGADPKLVGKTISLDNQSYTVVGIMPSGFRFPGGANLIPGLSFSPRTEMWMPLDLTREENNDRTTFNLAVIGRLKPGIKLAQARAEMDTVARRMERQYPSINEGLSIKLVPLPEQVVGGIRPALLILLGAVGFVLLIACANVANLLLARSSVRRKEFAIRTALGAGRLRLVRQLLTESLLLATLGGVAGLMLALWGIDSLVALLPDSVPRADEVTVDWRILAFVAGISLLTGLLFGLAPALQASKTDINESLKEGARGATAGLRRNRTRGLLVISEVSLSLVLLVGAGLLIKSFVRILMIDPGFNAKNVLTMEVLLPFLPPSKYASGAEAAAFFRQALERINKLPGVNYAGAVSSLPLSGAVEASSFSIEGRPAPPPDQKPAAEYSIIESDYFHAMGIPLIRGRAFTEQDTKDKPRVVIINQTMARRFWPGEDALGKQLKIGFEKEPREIVGIVGDVKQTTLNAEPQSGVYLPEQQFPYPGLTLVVRTTSAPGGVTAAVRKEIQSLDPSIPLSNIRTMEGVLSASLAQKRFSMLLLAIFAGVALVLAAVGIYGVMAYTVAERTHEIGIRMALGARGRDVLKLVVGQGMALALIGITIGLIAAFAVTRVMASLLYGVSAKDPLTFIGVAVFLAAVALLACYIPARRAMKVDPMVALRYE